MIHRLLSHRINKSEKSILLLGPRQTGKSTLLNSLKPDLSINLADDETYWAFHQNPGEIRSRIDKQKHKTIFIDEIQRIPSLTNTLQALIDENPELKFYLSGSSARKLRRGKANLLPGRIHDYKLGGLCASELNFELNISKALSVGTLPDPYSNSDTTQAQKTLRTYSTTYLREEIQAEALTRNLEGFARFLSTITEHYGQIIDMTKLAKKARVGRVAAIRFLELLEDTLLAERIYSIGVEKDLDVVKHPKAFFFDPGVINGLLGNFIPSADRIGALFEQLVYSQIKNTLYSKDQQHEIYFYRTRSGIEVDLIIKTSTEMIAIECKSGSSHSGDENGLLEFAKHYPKAKLFLVTGKEETKHYGPVASLGLNKFLKQEL